MIVRYVLLSTSYNLTVPIFLPTAYNLILFLPIFHLHFFAYFIIFGSPIRWSLCSLIESIWYSFQLRHPIQKNSVIGLGELREEMFVQLMSICLPVFLSVFLPVYLPVNLCVCLYVNLSICQSVRVQICSCISLYGLN